jgi:hypothetical protein
MVRGDTNQDVKYFAQKFNNVTGFATALNLLKANYPSASVRKVEPEAFVLRVLRDDNISSVTTLEASNAVYPDCQPDVVLSGGILCEFKSWKNRPIDDEEDEEDIGNKYDRSKDMFWNFKNGHTGYNQFKAYLSQPVVTDLNKLRYYFDERKITTLGNTKPERLDFVKKQFRDLLYNETADALTTRGDEVWGILENKTSLLIDIGIPTTSTTKKAEFINILKNTGNFFKFIYVK